MKSLRSVAPIVLLALLAACGGDDDRSQSGTAAKDDPVVTSPTFAVDRELTLAEMGAVTAAVCQASGLALTNPAAAAQTFNGAAHDGLHSIARQLQEIDLGPAATLLKAKQKVEADLTAASPGETLKADLTTLAAATQAGIQRLSPDGTAAQTPACG